MELTTRRILALARYLRKSGELNRGEVRADGRGHFLAQYDGEEQESGEFFIYRTN